MKIFTTIFIILILFTNLSCQSSDSNNHVFFGDELLLKENIELLIDKRVGVVTNHSAVLPNNVHLVDTLLSLGINITALFSPEHGIRGETSDGIKIPSSTNDKTGIPIFSLYGKTKKPTKEMLNNIDIILFNIQDIGARFYTYISTLYYLLQSAAENSLPVIVLDRPNPITGVCVSGPLLDLN
ncbi:MAG: exo-beta-N-acetylmuramidase NamZ domain-containing protein, partial [Ignavibacteriaceae bacterium]